MDSKFKGILFDFDGTLVDSREILIQTFSNFAAEHGVIATKSVLGRFDGLTTFEILEVAKSDWKLNASVADLRNDYFSRLSEAYTCVAECADASSALRAIAGHGLRVGLVTSAAKELVEQVLHRFSWNDLFNCIICGESGVPGKPDPALYLSALKNLSCPPETIVAVEDSMAGVRSASAAGLAVVAVGDPSLSERFMQAGAFVTVSGRRSLTRLLV
jgi:mannitol-1-/sugar-/sorbitol-6-/2-deoxyglucose-6-phosphatase